MKLKKVTAITATVLICSLLSGCGDSNSSLKEYNSNKSNSMIDESYENVNTEPVENKASEELYTDDNNMFGGNQGTENNQPVEKTDLPEISTEKIIYSPKDEIINADFSSGFVQIGNDIFHNGGYMTVSQFIAEYSDRYDMETSEEQRDYAYKTEKYDKPYYCFYATSRTDPEIKIAVYYYNRNLNDELLDFEDSIVIEVISKTVNCWYPKGICVTGKDYDKDTLTSLLEGNGFKNIPEDQWLDPSLDNSYWERSDYDRTKKMGVTFRTMGTEKNLFGYCPKYVYYFSYDWYYSGVYEKTSPIKDPEFLSIPNNFTCDTDPNPESVAF